jgi:hypothetical protein
VSVDQMVSPIPGLVAQITGILTTKRYNCVTVYVNQATRLGYVHLQKGTMAEETLEGKKAYARSHSISIKTYNETMGSPVPTNGECLSQVLLLQVLTCTMKLGSPKEE